MRVTLLSYGATIQSILVPDKDGRMTDVLLGYDRAADYEVNSGYLGACIGRNGNRIAGAAFCLNGRRYTLTANEGKNQLHGGLCGFDKKIWSYTCREDSVEFTTVLADGEEGFPGRMEVAITFTLDDENGLHIDYRAVSDRDTVANFTNHAYFNLNGHGIGDILGHTLQLQASAFTPAGRVTPCRPARSPPWTAPAHGFPRPEDDRPAASMIRCWKPFGGYDNNFCLDGHGLRKVAEAAGDKSGIVMDVEDDARGRAALHRQLPVRPHRQGRRALRPLRRPLRPATQTSTIPDAIQPARVPLARSCAAASSCMKQRSTAFGVRK